MNVDNHQNQLGSSNSQQHPKSENQPESAGSFSISILTGYEDGFVAAIADKRSRQQIEQNPGENVTDANGNAASTDLGQCVDR